LLEPAVSLSDFALALQCAVLALMLRPRRPAAGNIGSWFIVFFCSIGLGALLGAIEHGFLADRDSLTHVIVWRLALISIGAAAPAAWSLGAILLFARPVAAWITRLAVVIYAAYAVVILGLSQDFWIALIHYLPAVLFLLIALTIRFWQTRQVKLLPGIMGIGLSLVGAGVQYAGLDVSAIHLDHNTFYHLFQGVALLFMFRTAQGMIRPTKGEKC
jgi:hypothetical protein